MLLSVLVSSHVVIVSLVFCLFVLVIVVVYTRYSYVIVWYLVPRLGTLCMDTSCDADTGPTVV